MPEIDLIGALMLLKTWLLIHAAFFMVLLRTSFKNLDRRLDNLERRMECE